MPHIWDLQTCRLPLACPHATKQGERVRVTLMQTDGVLCQLEGIVEELSTGRRAIVKFDEWRADIDRGRVLIGHCGLIA